MLLKHGIQLEDDGGDVQLVPISALKGTNIDTLEEAIVLQAELMNLRGDPQGLVEGYVIESNTDVHRGCVQLFFFNFLGGFLKKYGCVRVP